MTSYFRAILPTCPDRAVASAAMAPSLTAIAESIQRQTASRWFWHANHLAACLGISTEELNEFILRVQSGGSGIRKDGTWAANPAPYHQKINLTKKEENLLNLHLVEVGKQTHIGSTFLEPSPAIVDSSSRYVILGKVRSMNKDVTVKVQREIAKYVMGTHRNLLENHHHIGVRRRKIWRL